MPGETWVLVIMSDSGTGPVYAARLSATVGRAVLGAVLSAYVFLGGIEVVSFGDHLPGAILRWFWPPMLVTMVFMTLVAITTVIQRRPLVELHSDRAVFWQGLTRWRQVVVKRSDVVDVSIVDQWPRYGIVFRTRRSGSPGLPRWMAKDYVELRSGVETWWGKTLSSWPR